VHDDEKVSQLVVLTVYARPSLAVCSRVLQQLIRRRVFVERVMADFSGSDHRGVKGLETLQSPVLRISVVASIADNHELEQITKLINRIVDVYKVQTSEGSGHVTGTHLH
jgi:hypothetical protein